MDLLETYYDKRTFTLYGFFVAVPGKSVLQQKTFVALSALVLACATVFQILKLVVERFKFLWIIDLAPTTAGTTGILLYILYTAFATSEEYCALVSAMLNDLTEQRTEEEEAIKKQFARNAKFYVNVFTVIFFGGMCLAPFTALIPRVFDILMPLNESRPNEHMFHTEFFIDQEKYYCHIYFFECCTVVVCLMAVGVGENMNVIITQHLCGMLAVVGHQLENITEVKGSNLPENYGTMIARKLQTSIENHKKTLEFAALALNFYDIPLTILVITTFCELTVSLVQVTNSELINMHMVVFTTIEICQFFVVSVMGQFLTDASEKLAENAYNAAWDICQPKTRNLLQMVIMRSCKPCTIVARGIYTLSIENFMSVMQTAVSFYMVIRQGA